MTESVASSLSEAVSDRPVRILLVSPLPPPVRGIQTWTQTLYGRGLPAPFELDLINTRPVRQYSDVRPKLSLAEAKRNGGILWQAYRALASGRISVMHLNCALPLASAPRNVALALIARRAKTPYIAHLHGTFTVPRGSSPAERFYRWAYKTIFGGAARILALGSPSYRSILDLGDFAYKTHPLVHNFIDFHAVPNSAPTSDDCERLRVIFTGALIESKGVYTIIEVANRFPNARFQLVGHCSDELRANFLRRIRELDLEDRVQLIGPVANSEILKMLSKNDVFLFPSRFKYEALPYSVAEAMAVGLPVAASNVGAISDMIDVPQGGWLAAPDDAAAYVDMLTRLRDDPVLRQRMGRHNRQKALREYDYDVVIRQICNIWRQAAAESVVRRTPVGG